MRPILFDTPAAAREWRKLPGEAQTALRAKIVAFAASKHAGIVKKMQGQNGIRLRAGDYRAIIMETATEVRIIAAGHRREIYK